MIPNLSLSGSSSASTGPFKSGDVGGQSFDFGGINTGNNGAIWWIVGACALAALGAFVYLKRHK